MARFRAIVSIEFDDEDLKSFAESLGIDIIDPDEAIQGELDNFGIGTGWVEQLYRNGRPTMYRTGADGIEVTINDHDLDGFEDADDDVFEDMDEEDDD